MIPPRRQALSLATDSPSATQLTCGWRLFYSHRRVPPLSPETIRRAEQLRRESRLLGPHSNEPVYRQISAGSGAPWPGPTSVAGRAQPFARRT